MHSSLTSLSFSFLDFLFAVYLAPDSLAELQQRVLHIIENVGAAGISPVALLAAYRDQYGHEMNTQTFGVSDVLQLVRVRTTLCSHLFPVLSLASMPNLVSVRLCTVPPEQYRWPR